MPVQTHTYSLADLEKIDHQSALDIGLDNILPAIEQEFRVHNAVVAMQLADLTEETTMAEAAYGGGSQGEFQEVDDFGRSSTQGAGEPGRIAFPLRKFQYNVGWTRDYFYQATPAALAATTRQVEVKYVQRLKGLIARAIFNPTNYAFKDRYDTQLVLNVKAFVNADGMSISSGDAGQSFTAATHTHYMATATLTAAVAQAMISNLIEHGHGAGVRVYVSATDYTTWAALTGFVPVQPANIIVGSGVTSTVGALDLTRTDDRLVGYFNGYPIYTRSWVPPLYAFTFAAGDARKPLKRRVRKEAPLRGLRLESSEKAHPLYVNFHECYEGFGAGERTNGVVMYFGGGSYVSPTILG